MPRELALVGGGHAHVEVVRRFGASPPPDTRLTLFDPDPLAVYSGMVPGLVAGQYARHELEIDLAALCARARADFVRAAVEHVDATASVLHFDGGSHAYDVASLDIGSTVDGADLPGVREHALRSRPMSGLITGLAGFARRASTSSERRRPFHVVGGGVGGVELALCLDARLRGAGEHALVSIVTNEAAVLMAAPPVVRKRVERTLARRGIEVVADAFVTGVRSDALEFADRPPLPSAGTIWVTGPAAHPLARISRLPIDPRGFIRVAPTFRVEGERNLFAVGDCASLTGMKKAGVYAVRSGPLLDVNLRAHLSDDRLRAYTPQHDFLSLLNQGDGTALAAKWGFALEGRAMMRLKDRIDRAFLAKYQ